MIMLTGGWEVYLPVANADLGSAEIDVSSWYSSPEKVSSEGLDPGPQVHDDGRWLPRNRDCGAADQFCGVKDFPRPTVGQLGHVGDERLSCCALRAAH